MLSKLSTGHRHNKSSLKEKFQFKKLFRFWRTKIPISVYNTLPILIEYYNLILYKELNIH